LLSWALDHTTPRKKAPASIKVAIPTMMVRVIVRVRVDQNRVIEALSLTLILALTLNGYLLHKWMPPQIAMHRNESHLVDT